MAYNRQQQQDIAELKAQLGFSDAGAGVTQPPADVDARLAALRVMITGQEAPPPATGWRMSNNSSAKRLDGLEPLVQQLRTDVDALPPQMQASVQGVLDAVTLLLQYQAEQQAAAITTLSAGFDAAIAQARTDLHNELLGSTGPLLTLIQQLQAHDQSDETQDAGIHTQLFTQVGSLLQQLQALQTTVSANYATLTTADAANATAALTAQQTATAAKTTGETLRTDLTSLQATVATHTASTNLHRLKQTKRVSTPAMAVGASVPVAVVWDTPFPSANYSVAALAQNSSLLGVQWALAATPTPTAAGCTILLKNAGLAALLAAAGTLHLIALHD